MEEVAKAVGGGYCRLQMPLKLALGVGETVAWHRLGALKGGTSLPSNASLHVTLPLILIGGGPKRPNLCTVHNVRPLKKEVTTS